MSGFGALRDSGEEPTETPRADGSIPMPAHIRAEIDAILAKTSPSAQSPRNTDDFKPWTNEDSKAVSKALGMPCAAPPHPGVKMT